MKRYDSTTLCIERIQQITQKYYEEGSQAKCYRAIWRNYIYPQFGIHYRTYLNYINTPLPNRRKNKPLTTPIPTNAQAGAN